MDRQISIVRVGSSWAIKHGDGYLGSVASLEEAAAISHYLMDRAEDGIEPDRPEEPRSWRPAP